MTGLSLRESDDFAPTIYHMTETNEPPREDTTTSRRRAKGGPARFLLRVIADDVVSRHSLPPRGEICLGRGADAHVTVPMLDVSRRHLLLELTDGGIRACDLGSANGTLLRGEELQPNTWKPITAGDWLTVGDATVVLVEERSDPERSVGKDALGPVLEGYLSLHRRLGRPFAIVGLRCVTSRNWIDAVEAMLTSDDHLVVVGDARITVFLGDRSPEAAQARVDAISAHLQRMGAHPKTTMRHCPRDGRDAETLLPAIQREQATKIATVPPPSPVLASEAMRQLYELVDDVAPT
ncbi:MAG: FHA domain-containing protein, partial [Myxococcales bacterium]|nr:FHA domain-containing protein [Myxococcales bacterium]